MNESSLEAAYAAYFPLIQRKCARMLGDGDEAADVAQETFVRLWSRGPGAVQAEARIGWIYRTSTRLAIDRLRRRRLGVEVLHDSRLAPAGPAEGSAPQAPVDDVLAARQWLAAVADAIDPGDLEVVVLSRIDGMTHDEIAGVTGQSERTVRRVLARVDGRMERLQRRLA